MRQFGLILIIVEIFIPSILYPFTSKKDETKLIAAIAAYVEAGVKSLLNIGPCIYQVFFYVVGKGRLSYPGPAYRVLKSL